MSKLLSRTFWETTQCPAAVSAHSFPRVETCTVWKGETCAHSSDTFSLRLPRLPLYQNTAWITTGEAAFTSTLQEAFCNCLQCPNNAKQLQAWLGVLRLSLWSIFMTELSCWSLPVSLSNSISFELLPNCFLIYYLCPLQTVLPFLYLFLKEIEHQFFSPPKISVFQTALIYLPWEITIFSIFFSFKNLVL